VTTTERRPAQAEFTSRATTRSQQRICDAFAEKSRSWAAALTHVEHSIFFDESWADGGRQQQGRYLSAIAECGNATSGLVCTGG
jgi:hypothetical protein